MGLQMWVTIHKTARVASLHRHRAALHAGAHLSPSRAARRAAARLAGASRAWPRAHVGTASALWRARGVTRQPPQPQATCRVRTASCLFLGMELLGLCRQRGRSSLGRTVSCHFQRLQQHCRTAVAQAIPAVVPWHVQLASTYTPCPLTKKQTCRHAAVLSLPQWGQKTGHERRLSSWPSVAGAPSYLLSAAIDDELADSIIAVAPIIDARDSSRFGLQLCTWASC